MHQIHIKVIKSCSFVIAALLLLCVNRIRLIQSRPLVSKCLLSAKGSWAADAFIGQDATSWVQESICLGEASTGWTSSEAHYSTFYFPHFVNPCICAGFIHNRLPLHPKPADFMLGWCFLKWCPHTLPWQQINVRTGERRGFSES